MKWISSSICLILVLICLHCSPARNQGSFLYEKHCASCHMPDGSGLGKLYPPLANSEFLKTEQAQLACLIKYGISDTLIINGIEYNTPMPGVKDLTDVEITNIINFINVSWSNELVEQKLEDVSSQLEKCN